MRVFKLHFENNAIDFEYLKETLNASTRFEFVRIARKINYDLQHDSREPNQSDSLSIPITCQGTEYTCSRIQNKTSVFIQSEILGDILSF